MTEPSLMEDPCAMDSFMAEKDVEDKLKTSWAGGKNTCFDAMRVASKMRVVQGLMSERKNEP